jgi:hypothetical protein
MTTPSEQWIVSALRQATDRMSLPPESRWIRERPSTSAVSTILVIGVAAILIIVVGMTIGALRVEPRLVPAAAGRPSIFAEAEDREWRITRFAMASDLVVLRPTWIPAEYHGSVECPSPSALLGTGPTGSNFMRIQGRATDVTNTSSYYVQYQGRLLPDGSSCAMFELYGLLGTWGDPKPVDGLVETTVDARGTTVHVRSGVPRGPSPPLPEYVRELWWNESGAFYAVISFDPDLELVDLIRVVRSLEPMPTER